MELHKRVTLAQNNFLLQLFQMPAQCPPLTCRSAPGGPGCPGGRCRWRRSPPAGRDTRGSLNALVKLHLSPVPHLFSLSCSLPVARQMPARNFGEEVGCCDILIQLPPTLTISDGLRWECERNIRKQWPTSTGGLRLLCHGFKLDKLFKHSHASRNTLFGENFDSPQKPSFSGQQK